MASMLSDTVERVLGAFERKDEREFLPAALEVVETPVSPTSRALAGLIIAFFTIATAWAFIGRVDIMATADGRILPAGDVKVIQPLDPGVVRSIRVQDGQSVQRGQLLVELDPTIPVADRDRLTRDLVQAQLDVARLRGLQSAFAGGPLRFVAPKNGTPDQVAQAEAAMRAQAAQQAAKISNLSQQIAQKDAEMAGVAAEIAKIRASTPMLEEKDRINRELTARGYGTTLQALDAAQAVSDARHDLDVARRKDDELAAARNALVKERDGARAQFQSDVLSDLSKAQEQENELSQNLIKAQNKSADTELRAPVDGVVQQLAIHTLGGVVLPGQRLMTVVPDTRSLVIESRLANKDVGFVYPGQPVKVKVETFNFTRYGVLDGKVVSVSRDTVDADPRTAGEDPALPSATSPVPKATSPAYVARIALAHTSLLVDGRERPLQPGMSVTAEIRTGSRTIADYLFSPIARTTEESLHER